MKKPDINKKRLLETFTALLGVNSPSFDEKEIGDLLVRKLKESGCRVTVQKYAESFNVIAFKDGNITKVPPLLLSGHMDTIEPTKGIRLSLLNNKISSTGSPVLGADDKSALAQILEALTVLEEKKLSHGDIEIVFTSAEEKGLYGARNLDYQRIKSRHALVLDSGGNVGKLVIAAPAHITYEMRITGKAAHAGIEPEKGISAIRVAAEIISSAPDGRINAGTTANIGIIKGGTATNVVSKEAVISGELRSHDHTSLQNTKRTIFDTARKIAKRNKAKINIAEHEEYQSFRIDEQDRFLQFMDNVLHICGIKPTHTITGGGSDANIFNKQGIKTINMSTGMQRVHSNEEYILTKDLYRGSLVVLNAITEFVNFSKE